MRLQVPPQQCRNAGFARVMTSVGISRYDDCCPEQSKSDTESAVLSTPHSFRAVVGFGPHDFVQQRCSAKPCSEAPTATAHRPNRPLRTRSRMLQRAHSAKYVAAQPGDQAPLAFLTRRSRHLCSRARNWGFAYFYWALVRTSTDYHILHAPSLSPHPHTLAT